ARRDRRAHRGALPGGRSGSRCRRGEGSGDGCRLARGGGGPAGTSPATIEEVRGMLAAGRQLGDEGAANVRFLALRTRRPLLVEGEPGVGKTELAKALAASTGVPLLRLQCYEGIDVHHALYDWDYQRQLLHLRSEGSEQLYSERFLLRRPLLEALSAPASVL